MILSLSITGILLSVLLIYFKSRKHIATIYLGGFFFLVSFYTLNHYILLSSKSLLLITIFFTHFNFLFYLIGPLLYWYIRSVLTDDPHLKKKDLFHLLPMVVYLLASLPYLFRPNAFKVQIATEIVRDFNFIWNHSQTVLSDLFSIPAIFLSRYVLILGYTIWSIGLLIRYHKQRGKLRVFSGQNFMIKWLSILLGFLTILVISRTFIMIGTFYIDYQIFHSLSILQVLSMVGLIGMLISLLVYPEILYGLPRVPESIIACQTEVEDTDLVAPRTTNSKITLEREYLRYIAQKSDSCMEEHQPFISPGFNLTRFSVLTNIPIHHLAYYFKKTRKQSFGDYRNQWRINHAKKLITEGKANSQTIEAIGLQSGFVTRNTFLNAFKRLEGITPKDFASQTKENSK
jgi:AraC-like DNA-binding protein